MAGPAILLALQSSPPPVGIPVVLVDVGSVVVLGGATPIPAPDALAVGLVDAASIAATLTPADAFSPALDDHGSVVASLASTDLLAAALAELAAVATDGGVVLVAASDDAGIFLLDLGLVIPLIMVVAADETGVGIDDAGAAVTIDLGPGAAGVASWSSGFRASWVVPQYPEIPARVVSKAARDAAALALVERDEPEITGPNGRGYISSRYWRKVIELDDEEVLLLLL